jgi:hypothetical protein
MPDGIRAFTLQSVEVGRWAMTTDLSRFGFLGTLLGLAWTMIVFSLIWTYASKGQALGKETIVRYVLIIFLLFVLQIAALGLTFLLFLARYSIPPEMMQQHHRAVPPSN